MFRAKEVYTLAFEKIFPQGCKVLPDLTFMACDEFPVEDIVVLHIQVPGWLKENPMKILALENKVHDLVEKVNPELIGQLAFNYEEE